MNDIVFDDTQPGPVRGECVMATISVLNNATLNSCQGFVLTPRAESVVGFELERYKCR
jgi:hypothetical protein